MTNVYVTDTSAGSMRFCDTNIAAASTTPSATFSEKGTFSQKTPIKVGEATARQYITSIHTELLNPLRPCLCKLKGINATWFRAQMIPQDCTTKMTLQPKRVIVEQDPGFGDLARRTHTTLEQCHLLLKAKHMERITMHF